MEKPCATEPSPPQTLAATTHADLAFQYEEGGRARESECPLLDGVCAVVRVCRQGNFGTIYVSKGSDAAVMLWEIWLQA